MKQEIQQIQPAQLTPLYMTRKLTLTYIIFVVFIYNQNADKLPEVVARDGTHTCMHDNSTAHALVHDQKADNDMHHILLCSSTVKVQIICQKLLPEMVHTLVCTTSSTAHALVHDQKSDNDIHHIVLFSSTLCSSTVKVQITCQKVVARDGTHTCMHDSILDRKPENRQTVY